VPPTDRPLLLTDIDGVISLFGFDAAQPPAGRFLLVDGIPHFLSAGAAQLLGVLQEQFELVWCSGWEEKADEYLPLTLGLPGGLCHLTFTRADGSRSARHWKLDAIEAYAGPDRPLAWIDDQFDDTCEAWATSRRGPTRLVATDPAVGLTAEQTMRLCTWAAELQIAAEQRPSLTGSAGGAGRDRSRR
jgi:HAD domain in Swiss Army Knife RNA repair proteins